MSVGAITNAFAGYAQKVTSASSGGASGNSSALQEATETSAQTAQEARSGDRVAIKKLQQLEDQKALTGASEPGKGKAVDRKV